MIRIEHERTFTTPVERGFSIITDLANWPSYWPGLLRVERESRWREPGDQARLILRLLGREVELAMALRDFVPNQLVVYDSVQTGLPSARHERHFRRVEGGFSYRIVVEYEPRTKIRGLFDRTVLRRGINRTVEETMNNLERVLGSASEPTESSYG